MCERLYLAAAAAAAEVVAVGDEMRHLAKEAPAGGVGDRVSRNLILINVLVTSINS